MLIDTPFGALEWKRIQKRTSRIGKHMPINAYVSTSKIMATFSRADFKRVADQHCAKIGSNTDSAVLHAQ